METAAAISMVGPAPTSAALYGQPTGVWHPKNLAEIEVFAGTGAVKRYRYHDGPPPALSLTTHDGAELQHISGAVTTNHATPSAIAAMVGVAQAQGWASVELTGADDFKLAAAEQLMRRGILISNPEMRSSLEAIRRRLDEEAAQALAAQARVQAASITPAHQAHQAEVQAYFAARHEAGELWHTSGDTPAFREAQARRNAAAAALDQARVIPPDAVADIERLRGFTADVLCARGTSRREAERVTQGVKGAADAALLLGFDQHTEAPTLNQVPPAGIAGSEPVAPAANQVVEEPVAPVSNETNENDYLVLESSIKSAARTAAARDDVDGVLTYRQNVRAHQIAELAWPHEPEMQDSYRLILDADECGYPWSDEMREQLKQLGEAIDGGELDRAHELFYECNLQTGHEVDSFARLYCREFDEARESKDENRPT